MRRVRRQLELVLVRGEGQLARPEAQLVEPIPRDVGGDVLGVAQTVHVADLVAVVGRDRHLDDPLAGLVELHDDLGVEVEPIGVALERDVTEGVDPVGPIAAVPLAEVHAGHRVLVPAQDAVAEVLVHRHAP